MAYSMAGQLYIGCYSVWDNPVDDEVNERRYSRSSRSRAGHCLRETNLLASPMRR
jgi:hypothetical protein